MQFSRIRDDLCVFVCGNIVLLGIIPLLEPSIPVSPVRVKRKSSRVSDDVTDCLLLGLGLSLAMVVALWVS